MIWIKFTGVLMGMSFALGVLLLFTPVPTRMWAIVAFLFALILAAVYARMITEYNITERDAERTELE